ncbi:KN motif and ankyrin repeat domain-containing protein 3-like [Meles meles]|uniref:KN motif and ankyrin repeat domain-containing protein 3-like n=1 Tax=Meles meles TaxID=9662 RepID=UPI001E69E0DE|nr:KN motif and ankyrin repeat domain-containing protein 3-like [Meles meles]
MPSAEWELKGLVRDQVLANAPCTRLQRIHPVWRGLSLHTPSVCLPPFIFVTRTPRGHLVLLNNRKEKRLRRSTWATPRGHAGPYACSPAGTAAASRRTPCAGAAGRPAGNRRAGRRPGPRAGAAENAPLGLKATSPHRRASSPAPQSDRVDPSHRSYCGPGASGAGRDSPAGAAAEGATLPAAAAETDATGPRAARVWARVRAAVARTHLRSDQAGARAGLQLALATLALAVEELLRDLALVAAGHRPVGAQFPLAPRPTLAAPGPAGREVAQVVVIQAVVELLLGAHGRPPLRGLRRDLSLGADEDRLHGVEPHGRPPARARAPDRTPPSDWLCPRGRGLGGRHRARKESREGPRSRPRSSGCSLRRDLSPRVPEGRSAESGRALGIRWPQLENGPKSAARDCVWEAGRARPETLLRWLLTRFPIILSLGIHSFL